MAPTWVVALAGISGVGLGLLLAGDESTPNPSDLAELNSHRVAAVQLSERVRKLEGRFDMTLQRVAQLERGQIKSAAYPEAVSSQSTTAIQSDGVAPAQMLVNPDPGMERSNAREEWLQQAGLSQERFDDMNARVAELARIGFEENWERRRQQYQQSQIPETPQQKLRAQLGDDEYDRYLYASGAPNRVRVGQVMAGSAAELAGLSAGDTILSYGDERVFDFLDLRRASYMGELGEPVVVAVKSADGSVSQMVMTRGPLGISGGAGSRDIPGQ